MAGKKSFANDLNPALSFISSKEAVTELAQERESAIPTPTESPRFVFHQSERETKSRRVQILIKPSVYDKLKKQAEVEGASVNAYINAILEFHIGGDSG